MTTPSSPSPFRPGQPAPIELFVGREYEISHIVQRGIGQVALGKPISMFIQGSKGIGKSSIVQYAKFIAEGEQYGLHCIYVSLASATGIERLAEAVLAATIQSGAFHPSRAEKIRKWLAKYVKKVSAYGVSLEINDAAVRASAPALTSEANMLAFFREIYETLKDVGVKGVFLALDEINGIASDRIFASFLKGFVETNAISGNPVPILLMLSGLEDRRLSMVKAHPSVDRLFDVVPIEKLDSKEVETFFKKAFSTEAIEVEIAAMQHMVMCTDGHPWVMHVIGDKAYWLMRDARISLVQAEEATRQAALVVGPTFVSDSFEDVLRTPTYRAILHKIAGGDIWKRSFTKDGVLDRLGPAEQKSYNNFVQAMKRVKVIQKGQSWGEWEFTHPLVRPFAVQISEKKKTS